MVYVCTPNITKEPHNESWKQ